MAYSERQIVVRARETAALLLRTLEHRRQVPRFVDGYAADYGRAVCTAYPRQYRETVAQIEREALLAMSAWVEREVPRRLRVRPSGLRNPRRAKRRSVAAVKRKSRRRTSAPRDLSTIFRVEFLVALGQALSWQDGDLNSFCRDLELYQKLEPAPSPPARRRAPEPAGPFVDRCAVLLDPSMFDHARRAAAKFQNELRGSAGAALQTVFSGRRAN